MSKILFHIGYPKAGSTSLQNWFIELHNKGELNYRGLYPSFNTGRPWDLHHSKPKYNNMELFAPFYNYILWGQPLENKQLFEKHFSEGKKPYVLSHEMVTSTILNDPYLAHKAQRIKNILPEIQIFLIYRNQLDWLKSFYRNRPFFPINSADGAPLSFNEWIEALWSEEEMLTLQSLKYDEIFELYASLFGIENIFLYPFEKMVSDFDQFKLYFCKISGTHLTIESDLPEENVGPGKNNINYRILKRKIKRVFPSFFDKIPPNIKVKVDNAVYKWLKESKAPLDLSNENREKLVRYYAGSNERITDLFEQKMKYPL